MSSTLVSQRVEDAKIFLCLSLNRTAIIAYTMFVKDLSNERNKIPEEKYILPLSFPLYLAIFRISLMPRSPRYLTLIG